jgi:preprotein translocase subunit SecG
MRTRFAIISMLVVGVLLTSTAGAGMALSGSSGSGSAGSAQYPTPSHHTGTLAPPATNNSPPDGTVQPAQQLSTPTGSSQLPFTGLVLIPLIILGVAMLLIGLVLRSRSTRAPNS